jgi:hypothetical protein
LVDAESELHSLDSTRLGVLTSLTTAFLLRSSLLDEFGGMRIPIVGSFQLFDAPSFLFVELVAHAL